MDISGLARNAQRVIVQNSPLILTSFAVAGVISTTVAAVLVTPEAVRRLEQGFDDKNAEGFAEHAGDSSFEGEQLTKLEAFKVAAPCYIPAALIGGATVAAIIFSHNISNRRQAALISVATIADKAFAEYRDKNIELNGANTDRKVHEAVVAKQLEEHPRGSAEVIILSGKKQLFFDEYTGKYFESTINAVEKAANEVNRLCNEQQYASHAEFYAMLNIPEFGNVADNVGWTADHHIELVITTFTAEEDTPAFSLGYRRPPKATFNTFR